jgi:hypothetical protein
MRTAFALAVAALLAGPASAVTVTSVSAGSGNLVTVVTQQDGLLEVDYAIRSSSPIRLGLKAGEGETGFAFNSLVDIFTAVENGTNVRSLNLALQGASFEVVGDIAPSFSGFATSLDPARQLLTIELFSPGEPNAVLLGSLAGSQDFRIVFDPGEVPVQLSLQAAIPEPATWSMLVLGFAILGVALRRGRMRTQSA